MNIINAVFLFVLMTKFGEFSGCHNDDLACHYIMFISYLDKQLQVRNNNMIVDCQPRDNEVPKLAYLSVVPFN